MKSQKPIVLMADDDDDDCLLAKDAFEESGIDGNFRWVEDGIELMNYLLRLDTYVEERNAPLPALILLDLNMPRKDGREALREIKSIVALRNIPIIVLTTSRAERDVTFSRELGANDFITKPAMFDEWIEMMKALGEKWVR